MSDDFNAGAATMLLWLLTIAVSIGAGILSWNWIDPDGFWGFVGFLIIWAVLTRIGHFIVFSLFALLFGRN